MSTDNTTNNENTPPFFMRVCKIYVEMEDYTRCKKCEKVLDKHDKRTNSCEFKPKKVCKICKKTREEHQSETSEYTDVKDKNSEKYNEMIKKCTVKVKTDCYGTIKFTNMRQAKFIRIEKETDADRFASYIFDKWNLESPELILSVTGAAQNFNIDEDLRTTFKRALMKAAYTTKAWIISGGTNYGVMRLIGEALNEDLYPNIPAIGIATWGVIGFRDKLKQQGNNNEFEYNPNDVDENTGDVALNPDHTHFVFVDDGTFKEFGVEIGFRNKLEEKIRDEKVVPLVLLVVEGGAGTIETVYNALKNKTPVILIQGTGGCADLIVNAWNCRDMLTGQQELNNFLIDVIPNINPNDVINAKTNLEKILKIKENLKFEENPDDYFKRYISTFDIKTSRSNIEQAIIEALSKSSDEILVTLNLAIKWNQIEKVKALLRKTRLPKEIRLDENHLKKLLYNALVEDRPEIVEFIIGIDGDLKDFLNSSSSFTNTQLNSQQDVVLYQLYKNQMLKKLQRSNESADSTYRDFAFSHVKNILKENFKNIDTSFLPNDVTDAQIPMIIQAEINLFIWAIFSNKTDIAKIFWRLGKNQIVNALMASKLFKYLSEKDHDKKNELVEAANEFEKLAIGVLQIFDKNTRDIINDVFIIRYIPMFKMDCLQLAVECDCKEFVAQPIVQNVITNIWKGIKYNNNDLTEDEKNLHKSQKTTNTNSEYMLAFV